MASVVSSVSVFYGVYRALIEGTVLSMVSISVYRHIIECPVCSVCGSRRALIKGTVLSMVSSVYRQHRQCVYVLYSVYPVSRALIKGTVLSMVSIDTA